VEKLAMGRITEHRPVLLVCAVFSRHEAALQSVRRRAEQEFGPVILESPWFDFAAASTYYARDMGEPLRKAFLAFRNLLDPARLPQIKHLTNAWESECAASGAYPETRPVNIDPGYVTEAKLVLATTKDRDHRVYLGDGIYAEVTLYFHAGRWCNRPWTYPDYDQFLEQCRDYLRSCYRR
jgi:hypothetical protein